jgi:hypothetical protein
MPFLKHMEVFLFLFWSGLVENELLEISLILWVWLISMIKILLK